MSTAPKAKPSSLDSLTAGVVAGCVEGGLTYPAEFLKTKSQLKSEAGKGPIEILKNTVRTQGIGGLYSGAGAQIVGTGFKAGVRFLTYDSCKEALRNKEGKMTPLRTLLAGTAAGTIEAVVAVTPSETIKTKLIQDAAKPNPQYKSTLNGTIQICKTEGFSGIYKGVGPTVLKQGANSAVRFSSYEALSSLAKDILKPPSGKLPSAVTFGVGAMAGLITVYSTMPIDNVKTRMQSAGASQLYKNSFDCLMKIVREEGVKRLWGGATPRLARLMLSGGIVFSVYEKVITVLGRMHGTE